MPQHQPVTPAGPGYGSKWGNPRPSACRKDVGSCSGQPGAAEEPHGGAEEPHGGAVPGAGRGPRTAPVERGLSVPRLSPVLTSLGPEMPPSFFFPF